MRVYDGWRSKSVTAKLNRNKDASSSINSVVLQAERVLYTIVFVFRIKCWCSQVKYRRTLNNNSNYKIVLIINITLTVVDLFLKLLILCSNNWNLLCWNKSKISCISCFSCVCVVLCILSSHSHHRLDLQFRTI